MEWNQLHDTKEWAALVEDGPRAAVQLPLMVSAASCNIDNIVIWYLIFDIYD